MIPKPVEVSPVDDLCAEHPDTDAPTGLETEHGEEIRGRRFVLDAWPALGLLQGEDPLPAAFNSRCAMGGETTPDHSSPLSMLARSPAGQPKSERGEYQGHTRPDSPFIPQHRPRY